MGRDKALLPWGGCALAEAVAREVARAAGNATLVGHRDLGGIPDCYPGEGPLGGILTALRYTALQHAALHTPDTWNLIVACDMPGVSAEFLKRLLAEAGHSSAAIVLPYGADGRPEPLCAAYHQRALAGLEAAFSRGIRKVTAALEGLGAARFNVAEVAFFQNVNTPEDWLAYAEK